MAGISSKINGQKGGRPKGTLAKSTIEAMEIKNLYIEQAKKHALPILNALIKKAKRGDVMAIKEFNDRVFGKSMQPTETKIKFDEMNTMDVERTTGAIKSFINAKAKK